MLESLLNVVEEAYPESPVAQYVPVISSVYETITGMAAMMMAFGLLATMMRGVFVIESPEEEYKQAIGQTEKMAYMMV